MATSANYFAMSGDQVQDDVKASDAQQELEAPARDQPVASRTRRLSSASSQRLLGSTNDTDAATRTTVDATKSQTVAVREPSVKRIAEVLSKPSEERTAEETQMLAAFNYLIQAAESYLRAKQEKKILKQRQMEVEESLESIQAKTDILADLIKQSRHVVIYTGAGISTSASIPDYRGPNGLWTQIRKTGTFSITKVLDLSNAEPTYTHMAIRELCRRRIVKHVVSQNCDGLHLRSGIGQNNLSEIHGNMYIEVCPSCERQYYRDADVTQQTSRFRHKTGRVCHTCVEPSNNNLVDTIVLYGERSRSKWPMNWERASKAAESADLIICMGSSLKTLRRYGCLWPKSSSSKKSKSGNTKLVIINLQHTPKDKNAVLKINGKCDLVMDNLMQRLNIGVSGYEWTSDPLLQLAVPFRDEERAKLKRNSIFDLKRYNHQLCEISTSPIAADYDDEATAASSPASSSVSSGIANEQEDDDDRFRSTKRSSPGADENRDSPSLFVSEITDDPDRKRLRMRIRAVNVGATGSSKSPEMDDIKHTTAAIFESAVAGDEKASSQQRVGHQDGDEIKQEPSEELYNLENVSQPLEAKLITHPKQLIDYAPPGWLGKSLGISKASSYRRKRHGNKGRKRAVAQPTA